MDENRHDESRHDDGRHVGVELKAAIGELRQLATQLADASREWWQNRRQDMNQYNRQYGRQHEGMRPEDRHPDDERSSRGYGEGYGTAGIQPSRTRAQAREEGRFGADEYERWGRGRESDEDVRGQYGGGSGRSGFSGRGDAGQREYGRGFDDSDFAGGYRPAGRTGDRESGYYDPPGEYSQAWGRERDPGRIYGPEDFSQRYAQGDVFAGSGYGRSGRYPREPGVGYGSSSGYGYGQSSGGMGRSPSDWRDDTRAGASGYGQESGQRNFRGRGPRGYTRSDERITEDLNERFTDDPYLDADDLQISVSGGVATLSGTVEQRWMKHRAEDIADACGGVREVHNEIRVTPSMGRTGDAGLETPTTSEAGGRNRGATTRPATTTTTGTTPTGGSTH